MTICPVAQLKLKSVKKTLRTVAPMIAHQSAGLWGDMVRTTLQNIELGCGQRMSEQCFDVMYEYGWDQVRRANDIRRVARAAA